MPVLREPTDKELAELKDHGVDVSNLPPKLLFLDEDNTKDISNTKAGLAQLKAHAGSILGGGGGALATTALLSNLAGPEVGLPVTLIAGALGAFGGGYGGQKLQQAIEGPEVSQRLEQEAEAGRQAHPLTSAATEIGASAIASGGWPSIATPLRAGKGLLSAAMGKGMSEAEKAAAKNIAIQSAINPAINSGLNLAVSGELPSAGDLAKQVAGGALFAGHNPLLAHIAGRPTAIDVGVEHPEPTINAGNKTIAEPESIWTQRVGDSNDYTLDDAAVKEEFDKLLNPKPEGGYKEMSDWRRNNRMPIEEKRTLLHNDFLNQIKKQGQVKSTVDESPLEEVNTELPTNEEKTEIDPNVKIFIDGQLKSLGIDKEFSPENWESVRDEANAKNPKFAAFVESVLGNNSPQFGDFKLSEPPVAQPQIDQKLEDFKKAIAEKVSQQHADVIPPDKALTENQIRITANSILKPSIDRPESFDRKNYSIKKPVPSEDNNFLVGLRDKEISRLVQYKKMHEQRLNNGVTPTEEQITKYNQTGERLNKILADKTSERLRGLPEGSLYGEDKNATSFSKQDDFNRYTEIQNRLKQLIKDKMYGGDEFKKLWAEAETIKNKNGGMPPKDSINQYPDKKPTEGFMSPLDNSAENLIANLNKNPELKNHPVTKLLNSLQMDAKSTKVKIIHENIDTGFSSDEQNTPIERSFYSHNSDTVGLRPMADIYEAAHEIIHAATSKKIPYQFMDKTGIHLKAQMDEYLRSGGNKSIKELIKLYYDTAKQLGMHDELFGTENAVGKRGVAGRSDFTQEHFGHDYGYYMSDLHEFIAHGMTEPKFQKHLNELKSPEGKSLWSRFVGIVREMLGLNVKQGSILEGVLKHTGDLVSQERSSTNKPYEYKNFAKRKEGGKIGEVFRPMIDRVRNIDHPMSEKVANAFDKVLQYRDKYRGTLLTPLLEKGSRLSYSQKNGLMSVMRKEVENRALFGTAKFANKKMQEVYDQAVKSMQLHADEGVRNMEPQYQNGRPFINSGRAFWPTMTDQKVAQTYREQSNSPEIARLDKVFLDYQQQLGHSPATAQKNLAEWKQAVQGTSALRHADNKSFFYSSRHAEGIPLPPEFTKKDFLKNLEAFFHKQATSRGFYKYVESNHDVMGALGEKTDPWGKSVPSQPNSIGNNPDVRGQLEQIRGEVGGSQGFHNEKALSSLATTLFIGPGTTVHKIISNLVGMTQYADNPYQLTRMLSSVVTNYKEGLQHATENGVTKVTANSWTDILDSSLNFAERMQSLAKAVKGVYSLSDLTDKWGAGLMQAGLEGVLPEKIRKANSGDSTNRTLIERLDSDYRPGKVYNKEGISQLASNIINSIQGTGDGRTMPTWMSHDSELAGFFRLSNWGISQTNRFLSDIYRPATRGDYTPLLTSLFGSAIGGYLIKELRESLQGKKGQIPSLSEIASSDRGLQGNVPLLGYNLMASLSYAGFGGMLSQFAKVPFDAVNKNTPQGMVFPFDELIGDMGKTLTQATTAIANDPNLNWLELTKQLTGHFLTTNFQLGRVAYNQAINNGLVTGLQEDKKMLSDKMNQLRRFDMVEGLPYNEIDISGNPFLNLEQKRFKLEQDPQKAMQQLIPLINNTIAKYGDKPDVLMSKLKSLKENSYATFPPIEDMPLSFMKYISYLNKLEGPEQAQTALADYMQHRVVNEVKSAVVP